jgi:hypothetical protein
MCSGRVKTVPAWLVAPVVLRRVWRYQRGNQNPYIEEQTTQWSNEKVQKDKQQSSYKPGDKSRMRKGPGSVYDKWNISVVICNTDIP